MSTLSLDRVQQAFSRLQAYPQRNPDLDSRFRDLIVNSTDDDLLHRINACALASQWNTPQPALVTWLLYASHVGLFELNWESHCPHCTGMVDLELRIGGLAHNQQCPMCQINFEVHADESVNVTFSISPSIRMIQPSLKTLIPDNIQLIGVHDVSGTFKANFDRPGQYFLIDVTHGKPLANSRFDVETHYPRVADVNVSFFPEITDPRLTQLAPGEVTISVNGVSKLLVVYRNLNEKRAPAPKLTGLDVMLMPDFQTIFSGKTLSSRESLSVRSLTVMFTDITGSTSLYQRLGDVPAYNLVRDHFDVLFKEIEAQHGIVIKTIGDAVMAAFPNPEVALKAALDVQRSIRAFNKPRHPDQGIVLVKIGIHSGGAIAVNLNNTLDYFGNMINLAARVQGKSRSEEVLISEETYSDPGVKALLAADSTLLVSDSVFELHGIGEKRLYSIMSK